MRAGTKLLQENNLFKTKESLGLTVPGLCQGAGLQFLFVPPFFVASSTLLVGCRRSGTFSTGVVAAGAAYPAVVVRGAAEGLDTCGTELLSEVGNSNVQLREVLQGDEELRVGGRAVYGEGAVGRIESCYRGAITGCGRCEVCDGFDRLVLVDVVVRLIGVVALLENGAGCGHLRLTSFLVGCGKKFLEVGPGLDVRWLTLP